MKTCFYAYSSHNQSTVYTIESAVKIINEARTDVKVKTWKEMNVSGKWIIEDITDEIDSCDVFICDLTHINFNVLFELGYAIAINKRIWVTFDQTLSASSKPYGSLNLLDTLGYSTYTNAQLLMTAFFADQPFEDLDNTLLNKLSESTTNLENRIPKLFYLKSEVVTDESLKLTEVINKEDLPRITDDPDEVSNRPLHWYLEAVYHSMGVVAHFLDDVRSNNTKSIRNGKYALVCGISLGFGKATLMLAHSPHNTPIDYKDFLEIHKSKSECETAISDWFLKYKNRFELVKKKYESKTKNNKEVLLRDIYIGEYVAEDEKLNISDYFIDTAAYQDALRGSNYILLVGRKGTGKTANLYKLQDYFSNPYLNTLVCTIKPADYDLEGVFELFQISIRKSETSFLVETLWKYLIYTELAQVVYNLLISKPNLFRDELSKRFVEYVKQNDDRILQDFVVRMATTIEEVCKLDWNDNVAEQHVKISETLHDKFLTELETILITVLNQYDKVVILVDNLDKAWSEQTNLEQMSEFLRGLLNVGSRIPDSFKSRASKNPTSKKSPVELSLIVFLRSDVFSYILPQARERDKLRFHAIKWTDHLLLQRIIEERFLYSIDGNESMSTGEVWNKYFVDNIDGIETKEFIAKQIIPRPRDMIYFTRQAITHAINRKHIKVELDDIQQARSDYSEYLYYALITECKELIPQIEELLLEFVDSSTIITKNILEKYCKNVGLEDTVDLVIETLCNTTFLGLEIKENEYQFLHDSSKKMVHLRQSRKVYERSKLERYKINGAFCPFLEIED